MKVRRMQNAKLTFVATGLNVLLPAVPNIKGRNFFAAIDTSEKGEVATDATQSVGLRSYYKKSRDI